ncbi:MAG TPA: hypothetical protein VN799_00260 [Acidimicrobiales bacterium]|nr:hypothetical protein [Acidimicrobiales bacterium]
MIFFALIGILVIAAVLVAAAMSLFLRRHGETDTPKPGWVPTDEVFHDPDSDRVMRVWSDRTGGRHSIPETVEGTPPL